MKRQVFNGFCLFLVFGFLFSACDDSPSNSNHPNLNYSIQVNNQAGMSRSVQAGDVVKLHILNFEYAEDAHNRALILIANGDRDMGSKGGILNNAGWYSVNADLEVTNDVNSGPYSSFRIRIDKIKVNETEYDIPDSFVQGSEIVFGNPTQIWNEGHSDYPNNFSGIVIKDSDVSLKTILTVEAGIIGTPNSTGYDSYGLAEDPFIYIKVEGRVNE